MEKMKLDGYGEKCSVCGKLIIALSESQAYSNMAQHKLFHERLNLIK